MRQIDEYKHLNETDKMLVKIEVEEIAQKIHRMNYGIHRFLCAWLEIRRANLKTEGFSAFQEDKLASGIEALLEKGYC